LKLNNSLGISWSNRKRSRRRNSSRKS